MKAKTPAAPEPALTGLLQTPEPLPPDAPVTVAAALLRKADLPALPVVDDDRLVGLVSQRSLLGAVPALGRGDGGSSRELLQPATSVPITTPVEDALWLLRREDIEILVVVGLDGRYLGVLTAKRLVDALEDNRRPNVVGGMATPLGVYLTSAHHRGGVGDLPLVLTGLYLTILLSLARLVAVVVVALLSGDPMTGFLSETTNALVSLQAVGQPTSVVSWLSLAVFVAFLRLSPLAGYHSGEHQTVHALERGLPLEYETVREMPRPHVRCGTNLVVLMTLLGALAGAAYSHAGSWVWLPLLPAIYYWRSLGWYAQQHGTTRPARRHEVESGVQAGRMLLSRHQRQANYRAPLWRRIWNRGIVQVLLGLGLGWLAVDQFEAWARWLIVRMT